MSILFGNRTYEMSPRAANAGDVTHTEDTRMCKYLYYTPRTDSAKPLNGGAG